MAHGVSTLATNKTVHAIMMAKPLDTPTGHPNLENVDHLEEQIEFFSPPFAPQCWAAATAASPLP